MVRFFLLFVIVLLVGSVVPVVYQAYSSSVSRLVISPLHGSPNQFNPKTTCTQIPGIVYIPCATTSTSTFPPATSILETDWAVVTVGTEPSANGTFTAGTQVMLTMTMTALSTTGSFPQGVAVQCLLDGNDCGSGTLSFPGPLGVNYVVTSQVPWNTTIGAHTLMWEIDPTNDPDPNNNVGTFAFQVLMPAPQFDFALSASPTTLNFLPNGHSEMTETTQVSVSLVSGTSQPVSLNVTGLSAGSASLGPSTGTPPFTSMLNVTIEDTAMDAGNYSVTITGTGGGKTHSTMVTIVIPTTETLVTYVNSTQSQQLPQIAETGVYGIPGLPTWTPWALLATGAAVVLATTSVYARGKRRGKPGLGPTGQTGPGDQGRRNFLKLGVSYLVGALAAITGISSVVGVPPILRDLVPSPNFWITGMEVIQAVQTPDNQVPLIGHKTTFVRVYVKSDASVDVTGTLKASVTGGGARELSPYFGRLSLHPGNAVVVTATPQGSRREVWNDSLNFLLDDDMTDQSGGGSLIATIFSPTTGPEANPPTGQFPHILSQSVVFSERIDFHVIGCVWTCNDNSDGSFTAKQWANPSPNLKKTPAPWTDYEIHRRYIENLFPVSTLTIDPFQGNSTSVFSGNQSDARDWAQAQFGLPTPPSVEPPSPNFTPLRFPNPTPTVPSYSILNMLDNWDYGGVHGLAWGQCSEEQNPQDIRAGATMVQEVAHSLSQVKGNDGRLYNHTFTDGNPGGFPDPGSSDPTKNSDKKPHGRIESDAMGLDLTGLSTDSQGHVTGQPQLLVSSPSHPIFDIMNYWTPPPKNCPSTYTYAKLLEYIRTWASLATKS
jgi:hypothetical protein